MKDDDENPDRFIIKIGSTQNIKERLGNISRDYAIIEPLLLDVIQCDDHTKLENMIHKNETFQHYHYDKIIKRNGNISRETYLVTEELYKNLITIIKEMRSKMTINNIDKMIEYEKLCIEKEKYKEEKEKIILRQKEVELKLKESEIELRKMEIELKLKIEENCQNVLTERVDMTESNDTYSDSDSDSENPTKQQIVYIKERNNSTRIPKVCQYEPTNLQTPIKIYDSPLDVERQNENISQPAMRIAYNKNTIYKGYRWLYIKRDENPPAEIQPTIESRCKSTEIRFIAMIDIKQTRILQVFSSQKEAVESRNLKCKSFTRAIQKQSISSGHYWNFFDACPIEWREEYLKINKLPERHIFLTGKRIEKIDPITNKTIEVFNSKRDVIRKYQVSHNKLRDVLNTDEIYSGYLWKEL